MGNEQVGYMEVDILSYSSRHICKFYSRHMSAKSQYVPGFLKLHVCVCVRVSVSIPRLLIPSGRIPA